MKILVAPDSFKGSLSAAGAAAALASGVRRARPEARVVELPLADGGEGTAEALVSATGGRRVAMAVCGPLGTPVPAWYGLLGPDGQTAVVEMAAAAGLGLVPVERRDPQRTTTYGVGELLLAAAQSGARRVIAGLGGSATNDGGAGALQALGVRFLDAGGAALPAPLSGGDLGQIDRIDASALSFPIGDIPIVIASDVTNPLLGPKGASAVYGPQKGAGPEMVAELEAGLGHYAALVRRDLGQDIGVRPGAGAAGGLGAALLAFLGAEMRSGIDLVLDILDFDRQAHDADWVFTGEGRIDTQTAHGKAVAGVLARCRRLGEIRVVAFGGAVDPEAEEELAAQGLCAAIPITRGPMALDEAMTETAALLEEAAARTIRLILAARG